MSCHAGINFKKKKCKNAWQLSLNTLNTYYLKKHVLSHEELLLKWHEKQFVISVIPPFKWKSMKDLKYTQFLKTEYTV